MPDPISPTSKVEPKPRQFSLRTLFVLLSLAAVVSAGFVWNEFAGIWAYLGCLVLFLSVWRHRQMRGLIDRPDPPAHLRLVDPGVIILANVAITVAAAIAFCCTCSFAQVSLVGIQEVAVDDTKAAAEAMRQFRTGLFVTIPCGTVAALIVYAIWWPRESDAHALPSQTLDDPR